jgi:PIN domain nuclease of toxin-antitoxin system
VILLLDAHALLWWLADDPTLSDAARTAIADPATDVLVSAATVWEISIKRGLGRLEAPDGLVDAIEASGFSGLPVTLADGEAIAALPDHHRDPFDRMLVAQAMRIDAVIVSRDAAFDAYDCDVLTA